MRSRNSKLNLQFSWLLNARLDVAFFFFPALAATALYALLQNPGVAGSAVLSLLLLQGLGIGPFHIGATWSQFENETILNHLLGTGFRRILIVLSLLAITSFSCAGMIFFPVLLTALFMATSIHHMLGQNVGILLLYHNHGRECVVAKKLEVATLHNAAWLCALVYLTRFTTQSNWQYYALIAASIVIGTVLVISIKNYFGQLYQQANSGLPINCSALMFWAVSICFFSPLALVGKDYNQALLIPLVMHWCQYIAITWIITVRRKTASEVNANPIRNYLTVSLLISAVVLSIGFASVLALPSAFIGRLAAGLLIGISFIHYLQDAYLWRFRDPVIRQQLLPYLKQTEEPAAAYSRQQLPQSEAIGVKR